MTQSKEETKTLTQNFQMKHTVSPEECRRMEQAIRQERHHAIELGASLNIKLPFQH